MSAAVVTDGLTRRYGKLTALDSVSLRVERGELFGLIGPDGAGKSTLYQILATLAVPDSGSAEVLGLDTVRDFPALRPKIGYMPERFSLYPDLTVMENLRFFASLFGIDEKSSFDLIAPIFSQLAKFPNRRAGRLSGGMKQKLALSCALIHRPALLLLDEPTTGVDAVARSEFWEMLRGLRDKGITIMVSTSYMDEATLCDRVAMIDSGKILRTDSPAGLTASFSEPLYAASASDMFALLTALRTRPDVVSCYTFGAMLHLVTTPAFNPSEAMNNLFANGITDARIALAKPDIEDLFIKLTRNDSDNKS